MLILFLFLIPCALARNETSRTFYGFQVLRVNAGSEEQVNMLLNLEEDDYALDFWTKPSRLRPTDIMVPVDQLHKLKVYLAIAGIPFRVMINNLEKAITQVEDEIDAANVRAESDTINWDTYHPVDSISNWLDKLAADYPEICSTEIIGRSSEGRALKVIKIFKKIENGEQNGGKRPQIWIDGGIHAREWISPAVVTFIINELVTRSKDYHDFLSKVDFHILPVLNPDGYSYTWTQDRMWRKTRSDHTTIFSKRDDCRGVDANRNFGYQYGGSGTSPDTCSEIYRGPTAFSEPESAAVRDYILKTPNIQAYLTLHSYSQVWVYPWGYASELPEDWKDLDTLARAGVAALKQRYGTRYIVGSSTNVLYAAAGGSDDWAKSVGIKYSYTIELRDTGIYGFVLPSSEIKPTALETWDGIQVVARHVAKNGN